MSNKVITKYLPTTQPIGAPSPLAVYWFNSSANRTVDQTGNGKTLTSAGTWTFDTDWVRTGLTGAYINGGGSQYLTRSDEAFRLAKTSAGAGNGYYTLEAVVLQTLNNDGSILDIGSSGESLATNVLYRMGGGTTQYTFFAEYGTGGTNISFTHSGAYKIYGRPVYLCLTCNDDGNERKFYINGVLKATTSANRAEKAASSNTQVFNIGRNFDAGQFFQGYLYSIRVTAGTYTDAQVAAAYQSILGDPIKYGYITDHDTKAYQNQTAWEDSSYYDIKTQKNLTRKTSSDTDDGAVGVWEDSSYYDIKTQKNLTRKLDSTTDDGAIGVWEDLLRYVLNRDPKFGISTLDANGHPHFSSTQIAFWDGFLYEAYDEPWAKPTINNFTGYAKDGFRYTNGVKDDPEDIAPWASEVESHDRGPRQSFPDRALVINNQGQSGGFSELVIFDLDQYDGTPESLHVWMRFKSNSSLYFLGYTANDYRHGDMKNGVLVFGLYQTTAVGSLMIIDFKIDGSQNALHMIRADNHHRLAVGKNITHRNTTTWWTTSGVSPSLRINSENTYRVAITKGTADNEYYVVSAGEDAEDPTTIFVQNGVPQWSWQLYGDNVGEYNLNDYWYRQIYLDNNDNLWFGFDTELYCGVDYYKDQSLLSITPTFYSSGYKMMPSVTIGQNMRWIVGVRGFLYIAATEGIYRVDKNTMTSYLCYTVRGGGGRGRNNIAGAGEIIPGARKQPYKLTAFDLAESGYLVVSTFVHGEDAPFVELNGGAVCIIRLYDDKVLSPLQYGETDNDLAEDGLYFAAPLVRK